MRPRERQTSCKKAARFTEKIGRKAERKLKAQRHSGAGIWFGLGLMGLVGWSIALPTILGAALGLWLDKHFQVAHSWTLALLIAGLTIGCFTAWNWLSKEDKAMREHDEENKGKQND